MRIGLLGPGSEGDREALRDAIEFLLGDADVEEAIYLGPHDDWLASEVLAWASELAGGDPGEEAFLTRAAALALGGTAAELDALLETDAAVRRLARLRTLPPPPARAVELISDRVLLAVHDKAILDEEDIANAHLVVYGRSPTASLKRFGPRYFLTPGPLREEKVGVVELEEDGNVSMALFETSGVPVWRETMARRTSKVMVAG